MCKERIQRHSFSPPEPLVLIDHVTKRNDGLWGREYLLFKPDGKVAGFLTVARGKLRCVNFIRCPKGLRSMGSNDNLLNKYFRAKYIDTQIKSLFHISFAFSVGYKNSTHYPLSFFFSIYFWQNTFFGWTKGFSIPFQTEIPGNDVSIWKWDSWNFNEFQWKLSWANTLGTRKSVRN